MVLSMDSWNEQGVTGHHHDSEMSPRQCEVCSPDICLRFLEPCIRMQTSTSWTIHSAQWTQKSAGTCSNSEFACVLYHFFFPGTLKGSGKGAQESLCARLNSLCSGVPPSLLFPPQKIHHREILHHDEVRRGKYSRCFQCVEESGVHALGREG